MAGIAQQAVAVMDLVSEALSAVDEGRSAQEVVCVGVAGLVGASAAAYVHLDLARDECQLVCWPFTIDPELLLGPEQSHGEGTWHGSPGHLALQRRVAPAWLTDVTLNATDTTLRLVALATAGPLTGEEQELIRFAQGPLAVLDRHLQALERLRLSAPTPAGSLLDPRRVAADHGVTERELEVLGLLSRGMMARSIAARMAVSPRTVHKHLGSLYQKLGTHDRLTAVTRARELGMLPPLWGVAAGPPARRDGVVRSAAR